MIIKKYLAVAMAVVFVFIGCEDSSSSLDNDNQNTTWYKPSKATTWQWQLKDELNLTYNVDLYDIDLFDTDASTIDELHNRGKKVICYFSGGSYEDWRVDASYFSSDILGNDLDGWPGEKWLNIRAISKLAPIMKARLDLAKEKGCDGVEPDNMDGYINNSGFSLSATEQLKYNIFIAQEAHSRGLSVGLKNDLAQIEELVSYFDFAVNEQCNKYNECDKLKPFIDNDKPVFNTEYDTEYIINNEASTTLCNYTNSLSFQTLVLPLNLDDSFRYSCNVKDKIVNSFGVGFGSANSFKFQDDNNESVWVSTVDLMLDEDIANNSYYQTIKNFSGSQFSTLQGYLSKSRYFALWVTKGWSESWFDKTKINQAIQSGKIPVFVYWYFGDELVEDMPTQSEIDEYYSDNQKLKNFLDDINGTKLLIMEPEFNKQTVLDNQQTFTTIIGNAIDTLKDDDTLLSLCITDTGNRSKAQTYAKCGYSNCALGDKYEWGLSKPIFDALLDKLDFISFQQMIGQFSRDPSDPGTWDTPNPKAYNDDEIGIDYLPKRIENMANYLYELYKKPIFLPYITIATASWSDEDSDGTIDAGEVNKTGWEDKANSVYANLNKTTLLQNHLFGYSVMELFDNPRHDYGGYQFFINNEYHLGVVKSGAVDEDDNASNGDIVFKSSIMDSVFNN